MAVAETVYPGNPFGLGRGATITSPYQFLLDDDTSLRIVSANSVVGVTVGINGLRLDENGQARTINEQHTPNSDRSTKTQDYRIGRGALLRLTLFVTAGAPLMGQTYVLAQLIRGITGQKIVLGTLLGAGITAAQAIGFPGSPIVASTSVEPAVRNVFGTTPAVGAEWLETCPTGARWELVTVFYHFISSAVAGQRLLNVLVTVGGSVFGAYLSNASAAASQSWIATWAQNLPGIVYAGFFQATASLAQRQFLKAGDTFGSQTLGLQAGDLYSAPVYQVREWLEVN